MLLMAVIMIYAAYPLPLLAYNDENDDGWPITESVKYYYYQTCPPKFNENRPQTRLWPKKSNRAIELNQLSGYFHSSITRWPYTVTHRVVLGIILNRPT